MTIIIITTIDGNKYNLPVDLNEEGVLPGENLETAVLGADLKPEQIKKVVIQGDVTSIGVYFFFGMDNLTTVTIPDGVTSIGKDAFRDCESLTTVTIPGVTSISDYAFWGCGLEIITIPDSVTSIGMLGHFLDAPASSRSTSQIV